MTNLKEVISKMSDYYLISEDGKLYSKKSGKFLSDNSLNKGYIYNDLKMENGEFKRYFRHQLVAKTYLENPENKPYVNHKDGIKTNNHITNLEWVTPSENSQHAYDNNLIDKRKKIGDNSSNHKICKEEAEQIFILANFEQIKTKDIANEFGITPVQVRRIKNGTSWKEIYEKYSQITFND